MGTPLMDAIDSAYAGWEQSDDTTKDFGVHCARLSLGMLPCRCSWVALRAPWKGQCERCALLATLEAKP
jgi:hypothetical protein